MGIKLEVKICFVFYLFGSFWEPWWIPQRERAFGEREREHFISQLSQILNYAFFGHLIHIYKMLDTVFNMCINNYRPLIKVNVDLFGQL